MSTGQECVLKVFLTDFPTSEISLWEGEAPAEPRISAGREMGRSAGREKLGLTGRFALPLRLPTNELLGYIYEAC